MQIFLNYSLHGDHDFSDSDILLTTTLFKMMTVNFSAFLKSSSAVQITSAKSIKKSVFNTLVKLSTSVKKTTSLRPCLLTDSSLPHSSPMIFLEPDIIEKEDELAQLSAEEDIPEFSEIEDL